MAGAIGWYGPLIDVWEACSHVGDYVQLLVFVHKSVPIQYKIARNGGEVVRMDVLVGDETRSFFPFTIWHKHLASQVLARHVVLIQNVKIARFGDTVEARSLHCSSVQCLIHPDDFVSKGADQLIQECRVGIAAKDKLQKVVGWLQRARLIHCGSVLNYFDHRKQLKVNWKVHEEMQSQESFSLSELCECENSCKATFHASIGEIFLPITWMNPRVNEAERMFISRRLHMVGDNNLVDDLITTGCQLCGTPVNARIRPNMEQNMIPMYCKRSSDRLHSIGTIYRPFLLYVWDDLKYLPILVSNKAAELLFGNITAEKVYSSHESKQQKKPCQQNHTASQENHPCEANASTDATRKESVNPHSSSAYKLRKKGKSPVDQKPNFYTIWLILLRLLFQHRNNSPLRFRVTVNINRDWGNGRLELLDVSFPAFGGHNKLTSA